MVSWWLGLFSDSELEVASQCRNSLVLLIYPMAVFSANFFGLFCIYIFSTQHYYIQAIISSQAKP